MCRWYLVEESLRVSRVSIATRMALLLAWWYRSGRAWVCNTYSVMTSPCSCSSAYEGWEHLPSSLR